MPINKTKAIKFEVTKRKNKSHRERVERALRKRFIEENVFKKVRPRTERTI